MTPSVRWSCAVFAVLAAGCGAPAPSSPSRGAGVAKLVSGLSAPDRSLRRDALVGLGWIGSDAADAASAVAARLADSAEDAELRALAAVCLAGMGEGALPAVPALVAAQADGDEEVARCARWSLDRIRPPPETAVLEAGTWADVESLVTVPPGIRWVRVDCPPDPADGESRPVECWKAMEMPESQEVVRRPVMQSQTRWVLRGATGSRPLYRTPLGLVGLRAPLPPPPPPGPAPVAPGAIPFPPETMLGEVWCYFALGPGSWSLVRRTGCEASPPAPPSPGTELPPADTAAAGPPVARVLGPGGVATAYPSVQEAIDQAQVGATVEVLPGRHLGGVTVRRAVNLVGRGDRDDVVIEAHRGNVLNWFAPHGSVRNLTLLHRAPSGHAVELAMGRCRIESCDVRSEKGAGVVVEDSAQAVVRDNRVHDCGQAGLFVAGGRASVVDNEFTGNRLSGIEVSGQARPRILRNRSHRNVESGVLIHGGGGGRFTSNDFTDNGLHGMEIREAASPVVARNRVNRNTQKGIRVHSAGGARLERNDLRENLQGPLEVSEDSRPRVTEVDNQT